MALNDAENVWPFREASAPSDQGQLAADTDGPAVSTRFMVGAGQDTVPAVDLTQILDRLPNGHCDFLKIDCEGCEYRLLLGCPPETLIRIQRISAETHDGVDGHSASELAEFLSQNGFQVRQRPNPVHDHLGFLYAERPS